MVDKLNLLPARVQGVSHNSSRPEPQTAGADRADFDAYLQAQLGRPPAVQFSAHARRRIEARNIQFSSEEARRLEQAVEKAASKGARESLILMDDLALVVSVKNRVVITAVDARHRKENVFTNIDSVVLT